MRIYLKHMNSKEVEDAILAQKPLIVPVGTLEAHGRHLPVGTDSICAEGVAAEIANNISAVIGPTIEYGITNILAQTAPASFFDEELYEQYLKAILESYYNHGFARIIIVNGHGGNREALKTVARTIVRKVPIALTVVNWWLLSHDFVTEVFNDGVGGHAAIEETAAIMAFHPELVDNQNYDSGVDDHSPNDGIWHYPPPGEVLLQKPGRGRPDFSKKKSDLFMKKVCQNIVDRLKKWIVSLERLNGGLRPR